MDELERMISPAHADVRIEGVIARAEVTLTAVNRATAELWALIDDTLSEARGAPEVFLAGGGMLRDAERVEFAERAAAADLAVRLNMSEASVRARAADARLLRTRMRDVWGGFREGIVAAANARTAAELARALPDDTGVLAAFDHEISGDAVRLAPQRFRTRARVTRERVHPIPLLERARAAAETRAAFIENEVDGMAVIGARIPADQAHRAYAGVDGTARALFALPDETRTLAQIRADVFADLLLNGGTGAGHPSVSVAVTVPVMTLLGLTDDPGTLDGYGPIDADTARLLAAHAPSFTRLLTHPVSGGLLDIDRNTYRPPADLKKWKSVTDVTCGFTGCGRLARNCDLDHTIDHQYGGTTRADNLMHLCRHHHRLKHMTGWKVERRNDGPVVWTSPTGHQREADPPPF